MANNKARNKNKDKRHKQVSVTLDQLIELWEKQSGKCALSGLPMTTRKGCLYSVTMDRIDSSIGYVAGNIQLSCLCMNLGKGIWSDTEFRQFILELIKVNTDDLVNVFNP